MINTLRYQFNNWIYGREIIKNFVTELSDKELDKPLPRKNLNTIRKQCIELIQIQECYLKAISTGRISFSINEVEDTTKAGLISKMDKLDKQLNSLLKSCTGKETIKWHGEDWNVAEHFSAMISHEQMHIGQIVAFCYATNINIPTNIVNTMALDG